MAKQTAGKTNEIDRYIAGFPPAVREKLEQIRGIIRKAAPRAEEVISYKMPAYTQNGMLVYFAGYKHHIGFYPTSKGIAAFESQFGPYKWSKGAVQFPLDQPLPAKLITAIVKSRIKDNETKIKKAKK